MLGDHYIKLETAQAMYMDYGSAKYIFRINGFISEQKVTGKPRVNLCI